MNGFLFGNMSGYGLSDSDCQAILTNTCEFFGLPVQTLPDAVKTCPYAVSLFANSNGLLSADSLNSDMERLVKNGVKAKSALSVVVTYACACVYLKNISFEGQGSGIWEKRLFFDFFLGVRASSSRVSDLSIEEVRNVLSEASGSVTYPIGKLRDEVIAFASKAWVFDRFKYKPVKKPLLEYINKYNEWLNENKPKIIESQVPFYGY